LESFEDRLKRKASEGNDHTSGRMQQRVERSDSNTSLDAFQRRIAAKSTSNQRHQSATSSFESRLHQKHREGGSFRSSGISRSRDPSPLASSFDERLHKKLSGDRTSNQSSTFEERLQRKLSEEKRSSAVKGSSFDERLQSKLSSQGSSRSLLSNQSSLTFEERLQRKLGDEDRKLSGGNRSSSKSSEGRFKDAYQRAQSLSMRMKIEKSNKKKSEKKDSEAKEDNSRRK